MPFPNDDTKFQEGESGNPNGRPKGTKNRSTILKKWIEVASRVKNPETGETIDATVEDKIAIGLIAKAIKGDVIAAREIMDSVYGKSKESIEHSGGMTMTWNEVKSYDPK